MSLTKCTDDLMMINNHLIECVEGSGPDTSIVNPYIGNFYWTYFNSAYGSTSSSWTDAPYLTELEYAKRLTGYDVDPSPIDWPGRYAIYGYSYYTPSESESQSTSVSFPSTVSLPSTRTCSCLVRGYNRYRTQAITRPHNSTHYVYLFGMRFIIVYEYDANDGPSMLLRIRTDRSSGTVGFPGRTCNGWTSSYGSSYNYMSKRIYGSDDVIPWVRFSYVKSNGKVFCYVNSEYCGYFTMNLSDSLRGITVESSGRDSYENCFTQVTEMFINSTDLTSNNRGKLNLTSQPSFDSSSLPEQL